MPIFNTEYKSYIDTSLDFSYDFRSKTTTDLINAGWTWGDHAPSISSAGATSSYYGGTLLYYGINLSDANKITIGYTYSIGNSTNEVGVYINVGKDSNTRTGVYSSTYPFTRLYVGGSQVYSDSLQYGTNTGVIVLNLVNKTYSLTGTKSTSGSLTDAQITALRTNNYLEIYLYNTYGYIQTVSIKKE